MVDGLISEFPIDLSYQKQVILVQSVILESDECLLLPTVELLFLSSSVPSSETAFAIYLIGSSV
jgi:hypothetical protein